MPRAPQRSRGARVASRPADLLTKPPPPRASTTLHYTRLAGCCVWLLRRSRTGGRARASVGPPPTGPPTGAPTRPPPTVPHTRPPTVPLLTSLYALPRAGGGGAIPLAEFLLAHYRAPKPDGAAAEPGSAALGRGAARRLQLSPRGVGEAEAGNGSKDTEAEAGNGSKDTEAEADSAAAEGAAAEGAAAEGGGTEGTEGTEGAEGAEAGGEGAEAGGEGAEAGGEGAGDAAEVRAARQLLCMVHQV